MSDRLVKIKITILGTKHIISVQPSFVAHQPVFLGLPKEENHVPPLLQMLGATATVSTLVTVVGQPNTPTSAGNGGFSRGLPCLPSSDSMRAVSSPQMYAPAPR